MSLLPSDRPARSRPSDQASLHLLSKDILTSRQQATRNLWDKIAQGPASLLQVFVNEVFLGHSHTLSFMRCLRQLSYDNGRAE